MAIHWCKLGLSLLIVWRPRSFVDSRSIDDGGKDILRFNPPNCPF